METSKLSSLKAQKNTAKDPLIEKMDILIEKMDILTKKMDALFGSEVKRKRDSKPTSVRDIKL